MATRLSTEPLGRPEPGQILIVIHDFSARSSDELTLSKGDRVELIERDDEFGDGWYLGRHLTNGARGLFPEVYTRIAPRGPPSFPPTSSIPRSLPATLEAKQPSQLQVLHFVEQIQPANESQTSTITTDIDRTPHGSRNTSASEGVATSSLTSPFSPSLDSQESENEKAAPPASIATLSLSSTVSKSSAAKSHAHGQDSPVMNETLSVIDEHITDMNSPHHSFIADRRPTNDSGSEYSSNRDPRLSYINGEETDEEEEGLHTRDEVTNWSPDLVAEYLFTVGVESKHCEAFRDQEITGDVLLGMDQTSVFLKEFDLGSVGRRLKTWQKIKTLQDEVNTVTRRNTATYGTEGIHKDVDRNRNRSNTSTTMLPRIQNSLEPQGSSQNTRLPQQRNSQHDSIITSGATSPNANPENPVRPAGDKRRPSAASIRDLHHSRQSSVNDLTTIPLMEVMAASSSATTPKIADNSHIRQSSFDRGWTMTGAASPISPTRPLSSSGLRAIARSSTDHLSQSTTPSTNFDALDRGYFSGGEVEGRQKNVLRKRTGSTTTHSRNSSYTDEQRLRSATAISRHSRFGSVDSVRESAPLSAAQKYYGLSINGQRRTPSESSINAPPRPAPPPKDILSATVTKLEGSPYEGTSLPRLPSTRHSRPSDWLLPMKSASQSRYFGLRAISDAVTGHEKARVISPTDLDPSSVRESPLQSPSTRTGSSTPSGGPSFDLDSPEAKNTSTFTTPSSAKASRKKSKKETSAYTRGLEKKTPEEQMFDADYSGWMKKKSTNLMTTWKSRLFVLRGRRLSYYYSESDTEEKGLIDISFHRVLPADTDRLTGLHATLTGATNSPTSPTNASTTIASAAAAHEPESTLSKGSDSMFIFKLVPPRAGLSRAVTFTKPTVHYFAVPNIKQGRLWMAALMKATIDRDDAKPITTTYQQKTISLAKARAMRHRPPALMNLDEHVEEEALKTPASDKAGLNIQGIIFEKESLEGDSGVSGVSKVERSENAGLYGSNKNGDGITEPRRA